MYMLLKYLHLIEFMSIWVMCLMLNPLLVSYGKATKGPSLSVWYLIMTVELFAFLLGFINGC